MKTDPTCLIVPVEVSGLAVSDYVRDNDAYRRWQPDFESRQSRDDPEPLPKTFVKVKGDPKFNGTHLHWQVPQALARGRVDLAAGADPVRPGENAVTFPPAPNRWLVLRSHRPTASGAEARTAGWVVESDFVDVIDGTSPYFDPTRTGEERSPFIGRKCDLDAQEWAEPRPSVPPFLTVAGPGLSTFSSFTPYNEDVFSMRDPLRLPGQGGKPGPLIADGTLSYLVVGWHSTAAADPLSASELRALLTFRGDYRPGMTDVQLFEAGLRALRWEPAPGRAPRCLYVGTLLDVQWAHDGNPPSDKPPNDRPGIDIAVGHSTPDARTALDREHDPKKRLLNEAFEYGALDLLDDALDGGRDILDAAAHATWFASTPAGYAWTAVDRPGADPGPDDLAAEELALRGLNADQWAYDQALRRLAIARERLYDLWWLRGLPPEAVPEQPDFFKDGADGELDPAVPESLVNQVSALRVECFGPGGTGGLRDKVPQGSTPAQLAASIAEHERRIGLAPSRTLRRVPAEPYQQATDPTVVLRGPGARLAEPRTEPLPCRVPTALADKLSKGGQDVPVALPAVPAHWGEVEKALDWAPLKEIRREFGLLAEAARQVRADRAFTPGEPFGDALHRLHLRLTDRESRPLDRTPEFSAVWRQPWAPLFLLWTVKEYPLPYRTDQSGAATEHWEFEGRGHRWKGTGQRGYGYLYGRSLLTSLPPFMLRGRVEEYLNRHGDAREEELRKRLADPANRDQIAQELRGVNGWLAQREASTHFDPLDGKSASELTTFPQVARPVGSERFEPVRATQLLFEELTLVDRFGRAVVLVATGPSAEQFRPYRAASVLPGTAQGTEVTAESTFRYRFVQLPPRLQQPARVRFEMVSARDEFRGLYPGDQPGYADAASPVCGWVVPDRREKSLLIHDAAGQALGELLVAGRPGQEGVRWVPLPGSSVLDKADLRSADFARAHPHLAPFLAGFGDDHRALRDLTAAVDLALHTIVSPPEHADPYRALFTGRPLALVRARVRIELAAPPVYEASWKRILAGPGPKDGSQLRKIGWRVRIGDPYRRTDGLVGLFRAPDSAERPTDTGYGQCFVPHLPAVRESSYLHALDSAADPAVIAAEPLAGPPFASSEVPAGAAAWVTLLMSPWTPVHAFSGLLPMCRAQVPEPYLAGPLSRMAVGLRTGPLLAGLRAPAQGRPPGVALPVPSAWPGFWGWSERAAVPEGPAVPAGPVEQPWLHYDFAGTGSAVRPPNTPPEVRSGYLTYTPKAPHPAKPEARRSTPGAQ